ncbi:Zinc finger, C2H2 domain and Zinc finger,C2H2-like domain-containing protein [Strongyloides ratti]|uniref:Zinc finger, C2H2 domain and Zinc finger,C2H2-like domain-containing protein n=1 Tax=Strongyloides ratti TaxID=34506 RepID=A0A090MRU1_STRRB|nr:Zinc finger, C2H2 domain and Zinc finger,C2H2-like domain-containing protein [Strongyloides ratti]CEF60968.1 Zinc finger, C2H2 domain and Zinc finger,C2H2-like domain-containing protein [Strongyloides ratti]
MNTDICSKNADFNLKNSDKQYKSNEKLNKVTSLLSFFSETTTGGSSGGTEIENKNGNISAEVSLSELTDIFGLKSNSNNENTTISRKRSNTERNITEIKRNRLSSSFSEIDKMNNISIETTVKNFNNTSLSDSKACEIINSQFKDSISTLQKPCSGEEVALLSITPAPALTPNYINHQMENSISGNPSDNTSEYSLAKENPSEVMPKLKEPSPISQQEMFLPHDSNTFEKKKCEFRTCSYYYKTNEEYRFHNKGHVISSSFKCSYCDLSFTGLTYLSHHEKMWCTLKNNLEKELPKPLATSTPTIPNVRKEYIPKPQPQRITFPTNLNEKQIQQAQLYDALYTKSNIIPTNKDTSIQNFNQPFIKQSGRDPFRTPHITNRFYVPETINKNKHLEFSKPGCIVLQNTQVPEPRLSQLPKPSMTTPIKLNICEIKSKRIYCKVETCDFSTEIETLYRDHYCEFHNGETNEICEYCSSGFSNKKILNQHKTKYCKTAASCIKKLHTDPRVDPHFLKKSIERKIFVDSDKREICLYQCEFKGTNELDMINHISIFHQAEGRFPCSTCELKFSSNDLLAAHEELYCSKTSEKSISRIKGMTNDYKCPHITCNFRTLNIKNFKEHLNGHSDNFTTRHSCNNCKQYFLSEAILEEHSQFPCCYKKIKRDINIVNSLMDISYENC